MKGKQFTDMKEIEIRQLYRNTEEYAGQDIVVRGWVRTNRGSNKFGFIALPRGCEDAVSEPSKIGRASCRERV